MIAETTVRTWHAAQRYTAEWGPTDQAQLVLHAKIVMKWSGWLAVERTREETVNVCLVVLIRNALQGVRSLSAMSVIRQDTYK